MITHLQNYDGLPQNTIYVVLYFGPPALQTGLYEVQLFFSDAVWSRVWWTVNGVSALSEGFIYGCPLATGHQALRWICVCRFTDGNKTSDEGRLEIMRMELQTSKNKDEDIDSNGRNIRCMNSMLFTANYSALETTTQPDVCGDGFTEWLAWGGRWRRSRSQIFGRGDNCRLGGGKLQHKLQHVSQRILGRAWAIVFVAVSKCRA